MWSVVLMRAVSGLLCGTDGVNSRWGWICSIDSPSR